MTGPEHYLEAERLLIGAAETLGNADERTADTDVEAAGIMYAAAQIHATLACAAVLAPADEADLKRDWREVVR